MTTTRRRPTTAVPIDGDALRRIRIDRGIEVADLATRIRVSRAYVTKLELGHSPRASASVHAALIRVLQPETRDAFRADRDQAGVA
ncbi:helix-turn-helix domain-containing protein [Micromonospora sp. Llam7]|uniref:helix-turn-helix domain-containing protein n=1 Tax=Micromonospora tarapacensis TaxID=2835305 RepID=UPI001C82BA28|nr:helix-turn-helix domain-containing protein [Micromonospora tarapacensis]MBX7264956.1 helix-turn-helix domain-containing protein [Micromonospora tarapacensis]